MKIFKSHFWYNKSQRNGIFLLVIIVVLLQVAIIYGSDNEVVEPLHQDEIAQFQRQIDSLKQIEIEEQKPKIYPFNPNYITDYRGEQLGLSLNEIDKLHAFRSKGKFVNSKEDFQKVTEVSDSLLDVISPYFKFPEWVEERNRKLNKAAQNKRLTNDETSNSTNFKPSTSDLNKVKINDLTNVLGINENLAARIVNYRSKLGGFYFEDQLYEVFNISEKQVSSILKYFQIKTKPIIEKQNINTIEFKQLLKLPYIDYDLCKNIFDYRDQVAELQNINELKNVKDFPLKNYDRIVLYLKAE